LPPRSRATGRSRRPRGLPHPNYRRRSSHHSATPGRSPRSTASSEVSSATPAWHRHQRRRHATSSAGSRRRGSSRRSLSRDG
jgi:hypothetical protein